MRAVRGGRDGRTVSGVLTHPWRRARTIEADADWGNTQQKLRRLHRDSGFWWADRVDVDLDTFPGHYPDAELVAHAGVMSLADSRGLAESTLGRWWALRG